MTPPPLQEQGPDIIEGTVTVDNASFAVCARIYVEPVLIGIDMSPSLTLVSPTAFSAARSDQMIRTGAARPACARSTPPHVWGGYGTSAPLIATKSVRIYVQFQHNEESTARLAVWKYDVPDGTLQRAVSLGRNSWVRFPKR